MTDKPIPLRTKELLNIYGIQLKKSLGQNFLTDPHVLNKIVTAAELDESTAVIEIGPGMGALTERLAEKAGKVVAVEIDQRLLPALEDLFRDRSNVTFVHGDAVTIDFFQLIAAHLPNFTRIHLVANLPYYVTSPILVRLLEEQVPLENIVVMVQKEVADRMIAKPGNKDYSSLSILVQYFSEPQMVARVPRHVFVPRPQVDSAVVKLIRRSQPPVTVVDEELFFQIVRAAFGQRRKTLLNSLHSQLFPDFPKEKIEECLRISRIESTRRGETLGIEEFAHLTEVVKRQLFE